MCNSLIENLGGLLGPTISNLTPKKVASGKLKKDKDGNWEFEYDDPDEDEDAAPTLKASEGLEKMTLTGPPQMPGGTLNLVSKCLT